MNSHLQLEKKTQYAQRVSKSFLAFADHLTLTKDSLRADACFRWLMLIRINHRKQASARRLDQGCTSSLSLKEKALSRAHQECARTKIHDYRIPTKTPRSDFKILKTWAANMFKNFSNFHINNAGDPFARGHFGVNTKVIECAVLDYFAKLWHIDLPDSVSQEKRDEAYWGYIVSMDCTEANLYAMYNARQ